MAGFGIAGDVPLMDVWADIVPVIVNWLNCKVTYRISLMLRLIAFEFSYESVEIDFDGRAR